MYIINRVKSLAVRSNEVALFKGKVMQTILQVKVAGLNQIAEAINTTCKAEDFRCRFDVPATKDLWNDGNPNRVGMVSARVITDHFKREILVVKICTKPLFFNSDVYRPAGFGSEMVLCSQSREVGTLPDFIVVDESSYPTKIDFYAPDLSDVPEVLRTSRGDDVPIYNPTTMLKIKDEVGKLRPKVYATIECF